MALKVESAQQPKQVLKMEVAVLKKLQGESKWLHHLWLRVRGRFALPGGSIDCSSKRILCINKHKVTKRGKISSNQLQRSPQSWIYREQINLFVFHVTNTSNLV